MTLPVVLGTVAALRETLRGKDVALVPTMGALHDGHLALVDRAREVRDSVVASIFVNPLQFGHAEDLDKYPRTLDDDLRQLGERGVDFVFAPSVAEMYPDGAVETRVTAGAVGNTLEGRSRPGHFDGVLTVVAKLLNAAQPGVVVFGQKDAQQVFLVKRMVRDLNFPVSVEVVETVRAEDGLALSSRNRFLNPAERRAARVIPRALEAAESAAERGIDAVVA
ncbi:MAG: pantoate--beta-alanine ligase, partial [Actinomycetota bacterium]|nr:pantoate--beta-alanine ligase [Actinomycetota bacterium]